MTNRQSAILRLMAWVMALCVITSTIPRQLFALAPKSALQSRVQEHSDRPFRKLEEGIKVAQATNRMFTKNKFSPKPAILEGLPGSFALSPEEIAAALEDPFDSQRLIQVFKRDPSLKACSKNQPGIGIENLRPIR